MKRRAFFISAGVAATALTLPKGVLAVEPTPEESELQAEIDARKRYRLNSPLDLGGVEYRIRRGLHVPHNVPIRNAVLDVSDLAAGAAAITTRNHGWGGHYACPCGEKPDVWRNSTISEVLKDIVIMPVNRKPSDGPMFNRTGVLLQSTATNTHTVSVFGLGRGIEHGRTSWVGHHVGFRATHCAYGIYSDRTQRPEDRIDGECRSHFGRGTENTTFEHGYVDNSYIAGIFLINQDIHFRGMSIAHQSKHVIVRGGGHVVFDTCHFESSKKRGHGQLPRVVIQQPSSATFRDCDIYAHGTKQWRSDFAQRYFRGNNIIHRDWRRVSIPNN